MILVENINDFMQVLYSKNFHVIFFFFDVL